MVTGRFRFRDNPAQMLPISELSRERLVAQFKDAQARYDLTGTPESMAHYFALKKKLEHCDGLRAVNQRNAEFWERRREK